MTGEDRREIIEYLFLGVGGLLLALGHAEVTITFILLAIYLRLHERSER